MNRSHVYYLSVVTIIIIKRASINKQRKWYYTIFTVENNKFKESMDQVAPAAEGISASEKHKAAGPLPPPAYGAEVGSEVESKLFEQRSSAEKAQRFKELLKEKVAAHFGNSDEYTGVYGRVNVGCFAMASQILKNMPDDFFTEKGAERVLLAIWKLEQARNAAVNVHMHMELATPNA